MRWGGEKGIERDVHVRVGSPQTPYHCSAQLRTHNVQQTLTSEQLLHHTQPTHRQKEGNNWVQFCRAQLNLLRPFSPHTSKGKGVSLTLLPYRVPHERGRNQHIFTLKLNSTLPLLSTHVNQAKLEGEGSRPMAGLMLSAVMLHA